jgi:hypothetical protein
MISAKAIRIKHEDARRHATPADLTAGAVVITVITMSCRLTQGIGSAQDRPEPGIDRSEEGE